MERIFINSANPAGALTTVSQLDNLDEPDVYEHAIRALIEDAGDYEESQLAAEREAVLDYYEGLAPGLTDHTLQENYDSSDTTAEDDVPARSTVVSTDVRDTIMAVMPNLMRIFAGSEHAVEFQPVTEADDEAAKQATDYIRYKFWEENQGFLVLYTAFKDALTNRIGVITWGTDNDHDVREETYQNLSMEQVQMLISENPDNEVVEWTGVNPQGIVEEMTLRFYKSKPSVWVEAVPLEEFRVTRTAKAVLSADLIGREQYIRAGDLIAMGYDFEDIYPRTGASIPYSPDRYIRSPYSDTFNTPLNDLVRYGEYYVRIDKDGDGINELRRICVIGDDFYIINDEVANVPKMAVFGPDPSQHTLIGGSLSELVMDIQRINTNLVRGTLDSLAQSIFPKTVINELLTNVEDALNEDLGAVIRTRGNPNETVASITTQFVGQAAIEVKNHMDMIKAARTGISDASRGIDPKALQSTAVMGVDLIASGAQERIELIARIFAETGLKDMYRGLLAEVTNNQNQPETIKLRGKWTTINPSTFNPWMNVRVNPALGKGSDMTRLMALGQVKQTQEMIIGKFGLSNGVVGVQEYRNTVVDMLDLVNIRNVSRYFREIPEEMAQQIESAPKEPTPEELIAKAEYEKRKTEVITTKAKLDQEEREDLRRDDRERDKVNVEALVDLVGILADFATAETPDETVSEQQALNQPG